MHTGEQLLAPAAGLAHVMQVEERHMRMQRFIPACEERNAPLGEVEPGGETRADHEGRKVNQRPGLSEGASRHDHEPARFQRTQAAREDGLETGLEPGRRGGRQRLRFGPASGVAMGAVADLPPR